MSLSRFAGRVNANAFAYGINPQVNGLIVGSGAMPSGAQTLTVEYGATTSGDGITFSPLNLNAPIQIGSSSNGETVTPTAVSVATPAVYNTSSVTATFANSHGIGDAISSGSVGLQEAINWLYANSGSGMVVVDGGWSQLGGTTAMIQAAVLPTSGTIIIQDLRGLGYQYWGNRGTGAAVTKPAIATSSLVASQAGVTGTWTATTIHVVFSYVTADGGETLTSTDYSFTSTVSLAIGGSGPAASTGVVGYRVYIGSTAYLAPVTSANGTVIQCGAIAAFKIGTSFSIATATTSALALVPNVANAFLSTQPAPCVAFPQPFQTWLPVLADVGAISAAAETTLGHVQLPAGWMNFVGRTIRVKGNAAITTNSATGTITIKLNLWSVFGVTKITPFTVACPSTAMGSAVVSCDFTALISTTAAGATGTLECHGVVAFSLAGTAVGTLAMDFIHAASSTVDLTKQDTLEVTVTTATVAPTAANLRQLTVEMVN